MTEGQGVLVRPGVLVWVGEGVGEPGVLVMLVVKVWVGVPSTAGVKVWVICGVQVEVEVKTRVGVFVMVWVGVVVGL